MRLPLSEKKPRPSTTPAPAGGTPLSCGDATECEGGRQSRFQVKASRFGDIDGVVLCDEEEGAYAVFALRGATLLDWRVPFGRGLLALTDGYRSRTELLGQNGVRSGLMAPFCNRIAAGRYRFRDRDHDLLPGVAGGERLIYHGFLRELDLELCTTREGDDDAEVLFRTDAIQPGAFPGYPYALALDVLVRFGLNGLSLTVTATNVGHEPAPFAAGWHPYFCFGDEAIDGLELQVPASQAILTDAELLPLPGETAYAPIASRPELDFRAGRALGGVAVDACLGGLAADADGLLNRAEVALVQAKRFIQAAEALKLAGRIGEPLVGRLLMLDAGIGVFLVLAHDHHVHAGVMGRDEGVVPVAHDDRLSVADRPEALDGAAVQPLHAPGPPGRRAHRLYRA